MITFQDLSLVLQNSVLQHLTEKTVLTPQILFSSKLLEYNYQYLKTKLNFGEDDLFFSVKSNYLPQVLDRLKKQNSGFEIGSLKELERLQSIDIQPNKIVFSNPVKMPSHIEAAYKYGVRTFAFDNENELHKIATHAPNSDVYVRLSISNEGATWELTDKFGASPTETLVLFQKAKKLGLNPVGITVHVGWNNNQLETWEKTMQVVKSLVNQCISKDIHLEFIDLGGGFPAHLVNQYIELDKIANTIQPYLDTFRKEYHLRIIAEPGSFLVANTATMLVRIFDIVERNGKHWLYVDSGINQGFYWIHTGLEYAIISPGTNSMNLKEYIVTGPTCDTHDIFTKNAQLPDNLKVGDFLLVYPAGAYINASTEYNGFACPTLVEME